MRIEDFIQTVLENITAGINQFNSESEDAYAKYPQKVSFEVYVDNEGYLGSDHKITFEVPIQEDEQIETEE